MAAAKQAGANQLQERKGDERSQDLQAQKTATLLGMSQQRVGAANQARAQARAAQMGAIGDIAGAGLSMVTAGMGAKKPELTDNNYGLKKDGSGKIDAMSEEYQDTISQLGRDYLNS
jgi:hypothetical protein